ncbi:hypothetical protein H8784_10210 [Parabacteroides acidifaciens]|uniref:MG2 domain protein n=1 Tax=Parabacteroides acidifaciens TaxID=2290935 RepID=A0A3D8HF54_9BACT|nr:hypothetical protein [Parabacteroides acidifaciens]MBC8602088.1 hypothetical protein [Parabacteroides acidifaciens]RDU49187.1 hypothetical protein DWU89_10470 [Parabacteroides acidifaciens]
MKSILLTIFLLTYTCLPCFCQQAVDEAWVASIDKEYAVFPSELIYLQVSKGIYEIGEDLWFKAYQLNAQSFGLSDQSKTLYLQMINCEDSIVWQEKYPVENGMAFGHVYVSEKLSEGDYFLEAYTRHSFHNDTTGIISSRKIRVVKNIAHDSQQPENIEKDRLQFDLFPEGGNLVSGLPSRVAFKATNGRGYPVAVKGTLYQGDAPVIRFESRHDGMGAFFFTPDSEKKYRIELDNGAKYSLPEIYLQGMTLCLFKQDKKHLEFFISQAEGSPAQEICLLGQIRGMICCVAKGVLKDRLKIKMPLNEFPYQGIVEFTLFNGNMQPVAERLVYVNPEKKMRIKIEPDKKTYAIREKATLKIKVTDENGRPLKTNLGISVFDKAYDNPADPVNILTHCYLSSQVRGKIHNPLYYFDDKNKDRMSAMDLLLLTQGWRRYVWNIENAPDHENLFLSDEIMGIQSVGSKKKGKKAQGTEQLIQISGAEGNSMYIWADSTGSFTVGTDMLKELRGGYVYLKPMLSNEYKPKLEIEDCFAQIDSIRKKKSRYYPSAEPEQDENGLILDLPVVSSDSTVLLDGVTVTGKARRAFRDKFMGRLDSLAQKDLNNIWVCNSCGLLLNYKPGYDGHHAVNGCRADSMSRPVDGQTYRIAKFEHFQSSGVGIPFRVIDEQLVVYHGPLYSEAELLRMNNIWRAKGYYAEREFYKPDEIDMQLSTPDARNTLLWEPSVITDEKGEAEVTFFCSDINTGFIGVAEGVDGTGLLGSGKCEFRVIRK